MGVSYIIAANYHHACLVAEAVGLDQWRYVREPASLYGVRDVRIYIYDTIEWRPDYDALAELLERFPVENVVVITESFL